QSFSVSWEAVSAWLRQGELIAQSQTCRPFQLDAFQRVILKSRELTRIEPEAFLPLLSSTCASAGVVIVFLPELPQTRIYGATRWVSGSKALIQLSLRYKSDDHLWFTFFHEAGHLILHGKRDVFIETGGRDGRKEDEADAFAAETLIPKEKFLAFKAEGCFSTNAVNGFAERIRVSPGVVVGRLQHEGLIPRSHLNKLKRWFEWT